MTAKRRDPHRLVAEIARHRRSARVSQGALAEFGGVSPVTVWGWEAGRHVPRIDDLDACARMVGYRLALVPLEDGHVDGD